jgi:PIN domain nuclease of toxin-antitoxin system
MPSVGYTWSVPSEIGWQRQRCTWEAPLTHEIVVAAQALPLEDPDPVDRFLAATAEELGLTLVTADRRLLGLEACPERGCV